MKRAHGFTLVELIVVMVIIGVLAGSVVVYFGPAIQGFLDVRRRANLTDMADGAVRAMTRDIRSAVANSIRSPNTDCFELVPTSSGGRYRKAPDTAWDAANASNPTQWVNTLTTTSGFDVVTPLATTPVAGDYVVINNQETADVYNGTSIRTLSNVATIDSSIGTYRFTLNTPMQVDTGYDSARFVVVPAAQQAVTYACIGAGINASGDGTGTLYRFSGYGFAAASTSCPAASANASIVATNVRACTFTYAPNAGGTTNTGYMRLQITLTENNESVPILVGTHTDNTP